MDPVQFFTFLIYNELFRQARWMNLPKNAQNQINSVQTLRDFWVNVLNNYAMNIVNSKISSSSRQIEVYNLMHFLNYMLSYSRAEMERFKSNNTLYDSKTIDERRNAIIKSFVLFFYNQET
ncbi:MAG: hypothetical protein QW727_03755 [Candidatus Pacearchaeota archaeon]